MLGLNYYKVGGSLSSNHPSYVERQADKELYQCLTNGDFCCVFNSRQMGKSSLRVQIRNKLEHEGIRCTSIDMTTIGSSDYPIESFYAGITFELWSGFLEEISTFYPWWEQNKPLSPLQRLNLFIENVLLKQISAKIVIFIDEIDNLIFREVKDEFLEFIRACYNKRADKPEYQRITFCLLGVVTPSDLKNKKGTPFDIGKSIELMGFKFEEAKLSLTHGLAQRVDNSEIVLKEILAWTGGQPFLTQKLCKLVVEYDNLSQSSIRNIVEVFIINNWEYQDQPEHLRTIKNRIISNSKQDHILLELYKQILQKGEIDANNNPAQLALQLSGLVVKQQAKLLVYNEIYKKVFTKDWVEQKLALLSEDSEDSQDLSKNDNTKLNIINFSTYNLLAAITPILAVSSGVSLGFAYVFADSEPWNDAYNQTGIAVAIEFVRTCILLTLNIYLIGYEFNEEFNQLIKEKQFSGRRKMMYAVGLIFSLILLLHHLYFAPHQLLQNKQVSFDKYFHQYLIPYICYLPYSFINFIVIGIPIAGLIIHLIVEDFKKLANQLQEYKKFLEQIVIEVAKSVEVQSIENKIDLNLQYLYSAIRDTQKGCTNLISSMFIIVYFGLIFSTSTFSNSAYIWTELFFLFWIIFPIASIFLWVWLGYRRNLDKTIEVLSGLNVNLNEINKKYSFMGLLSNITANNFFRIVCVIYSFQLVYLIVSSLF